MVLMILTIASFALAVVFGVMAWRLTRAERLRADARVAALAQAIDGASGAEASAPPMFAHTRASAVQGRPLLKLAAGFGVAVTMIVLIAMAGDRRVIEPATGSVATAGESRSLELLSMRHSRTGEVLTVTGLVRNGDGETPDGLTAVVLAFDREGNYVASGRAPLEFPRLAAGDESPFRVTVPDVKDVGRYRVSFRTDAGVVRHVDRRAAVAKAAAEPPALQVPN